MFSVPFNSNLQLFIVSLQSHGGVLNIDFVCGKLAKLIVLVAFLVDVDPLRYSAGTSMLSPSRDSLFLLFQSIGLFSFLLHCTGKNPHNDIE